VDRGEWIVENEKPKAGLEALAGDVPLPPAKASSPVPIFHFPLSIIHYPLSINQEVSIIYVLGSRYWFRSSCPVSH
jgi:hypothetical protein